jgi:hypothetical protein
MKSYQYPDDVETTFTQIEETINNDKKVFFFLTLKVIKKK